MSLSATSEFLRKMGCFGYNDMSLKAREYGTLEFLWNLNENRKYHGPN